MVMVGWHPNNLRFAHPTTDCVGGPPIHVTMGGHGFSDATPPLPETFNKWQKYL